MTTTAAPDIEFTFTPYSPVELTEPVSNTATSYTQVVLDGADKTRRDALRDAFIEKTAEKAQRDPRSLLVELSVDWGMSWSEIARLIGVTVPALRKWRLGDSPRGENRLAIARLVAFLDLLSQARIHEPVGWLEVPIVQGYSIRGVDLYAAGEADLLLDYALSSDMRPQDLLDGFDPDWHIKYREGYEIFETSSGERLIRRRRD